MASLSKTITDGKPSFRLMFAAGGKRRTLYLGSIRESAANKIKSRVEDLVTSAKHKLRLEVPVLDWLKTLDLSMVGKLESFGLALTDDAAELIKTRRDAENPDADKDLIPTLREFCQWYIAQRKWDCQRSTIKKLTASLNQLCDYCREFEEISTVHDVNSEMAFRFQRHRLEHKAEATAAGDIKVAKAAFRFGVRSGKFKLNPFRELKLGSEVNLDSHYIIPVSDYERLINACPNSTWQAIIALGRLGGLRCPSELAGLLWQHVNWEAGTILVTSPKTKRYGKGQRTIPLFSRLREVLEDHLEITGEKSAYVIDIEPLRRSGSSLSTRFHKIREKAGIAEFPSPFRNLRLSAANDVCRLPGITPKNMVDWFGHDMKTALKHYHRTTEGDFATAVLNDPFQDQIIAERTVQKSNAKSDALLNESNAKSDARTPRHRGATERKHGENENSRRVETHEKATNYPTRVRTIAENVGNNDAGSESNAKSDALENEQRLIWAFRRLSVEDQKRLIEWVEMGSTHPPV